MGARPSTAKTGGGFLNNVDGVITDYEFTTEKPGKDKGGKKKNKDFTAIYFRLSVQVDGAEKVDQTSLYTGVGAETAEISEDGKTLTPVEDGEEILFPASKPFMLFMGSLCDRGFDEANFPEDGEPVNYEAVIDQRVRFVQQVDEKATKEQGPRVAADGKKYPRTNLVISEVYGAAEQEEKPKSKGGKANPPSKSAKGKVKEEEPDHTDAAKEVLLAILEKEDSIARNKIGVPALKVMMKLKTENRDDVLEVLKSAEFLETEDGWSYDAKKGVVTSE